MRRISRRSCLGGLLGTAAAIVAPAAAQESVPFRDPPHTFEREVVSWRRRRRRNVVMQQYDYSCGAAAVATVLRYYWEDPVNEKLVLDELLKILTVEEIKDRVKNGMSITDLRRASVAMGYLSSIGTMTLDKLAKAKIPLIVPITLNGYDHFVVYRGVADGRVYLADPIRGNVRPTVPEFRGQWKDNAMLVIVKKGQGPRESSPLSIRPGEIFLGETNRQWLNKQLPQPNVLGQP